MSAASALPAGVTVLERGWLSSNNVVFSTGVTAVVDTGYTTHATQTVALVSGTLGGAELQLIVNTHLHSDHCGGNAELAVAFPNARRLIPPGLADAVSRWDESVLTFAATGQECPRFGFDGLLSPGERIRLGDRPWDIHAAPGHDPDSVVLFEPVSRTLISADALWENGFGVVFPELDDLGGFTEVGDTLDVIESLRPSIVIPGHGSVIDNEAGVTAALSRARSRLRNLIADPGRHAAHAIKVLLKFKLLELQCIEFERLCAWAETTPYMHSVHARFGQNIPLRQWLEMLTAELENSGAVRRADQMIYNT